MEDLSRDIRATLLWQHNAKTIRNFHPSRTQRPCLREAASLQSLSVVSSFHAVRFPRLRGRRTSMFRSSQHLSARSRSEVSGGATLLSKAEARGIDSLLRPVQLGPSSLLVAAAALSQASRHKGG